MRVFTRPIELLTIYEAITYLLSLFLGNNFNIPCLLIFQEEICHFLPKKAYVLTLMLASSDLISIFWPLGTSFLPQLPYSYVRNTCIFSLPDLCIGCLNLFITNKYMGDFLLPITFLLNFVLIRSTLTTLFHF